MLLFDEVKEKLGAEAAEWLKTVFSKHAVPNDQYVKKAEEARTAQAELETAKAAMEATSKKVSELESVAGQSEELKKSLQTIQDEFNGYKSGEGERLTAIKKAAAAEKYLLTQKANPDALELLVGKLDLAKVTMKEDGTLDGIDSQVESLRTAKSSLFGVVSAESPAPNPGTPPAEVSGIETKIRAQMGLTA